MESTAARGLRPDSAETAERRVGGLAAEDLAWLGLVPGALLVWAALNWLAPPLSELYPDSGYAFYPEVRALQVDPEQVENARFLLLAVAPMLLVAAVLALGAPGRGRRLLWPAVVAVQLGCIAFAAWSVSKQPEARTISYLSAFKPYLLPRPNLLLAPLLGAAIAFTAVHWDGRRLMGLRERLGGIARRRWLPHLIAVLLTALWLLPGVITDQLITTNGLIPAGHLHLEFDEFLAAANGRTPLVDFVSWYSNLLPIVLAPVWPLFDWSVTSFTVVMLLLTLAGMLALYAALRELTQGSWSALALYLPLMAFALQPWSTQGAVREFNGIYFAILPDRYLGPLIAIWLTTRHLRRGSPPGWAVYLVAGLAVFNSPEFGAACLLAVVFAFAFGADREVSGREWLGRQLIAAGAGLLAALALVCAITLIRTGELPDLALLGYVARLAGRGYGEVQLRNEWGFFWLLYLTYVAALLTAAVRFANRAPDRTLTGMLGFAGIFGLASGAYFAGRSLPWQLWGLFPAWGLALTLLGWTAWLAIRAAGRGPELRRVLLPAVAGLAGLGVMVASLDRLPVPWQQVERIGGSGPAIYDRRDQQEFIERRTEAGERVLILGWALDHRLAERAGVVNVSPWFGAQSLFGPNETERAIDQLEDEGGSLVFLAIARPDWKATEEGIAPRVEAMLRARGYTPVDRQPSTGLVEWRAKAAG